MVRKFLVTAALAAAVSAGSFALAGDGARTPDQILTDYKAIEVPKPDPARSGDRAYMTETRDKAMAAMRQRADLARELYNVDPNHPEVPKLMRDRVQVLLSTGDVDTARREIDELLAKTTDAKFKADLTFMNVQHIGRTREGSPEEFVKQVEEFMGAYPEDPRGGQLLMMAAQATEDPARKLAMYKDVVAKFPESPAAGQAGGKVRQAEGVGKPFTISFTDAVSGNAVSSESLKGKVVVVDFWATWCGPCVAEMPKMKEIYAKYKDKGVEFVGISLDAPESEGGLQALKDYVAQNDIKWPQYYQGKGWQGEFSTSWGINSIPALFIVDQKGNLHSTEARGHVEEMIEALLNGGPKVEKTRG